MTVVQHTNSQLKLDIIDSAEALAQLKNKIGQPGWIAIDTEANAPCAYPARLCLIQIAYHSGEAIIDPIAVANDEVANFLGALSECQWIIHSADYDLKLFYSTYGLLPKRLFDTMVAARLIGERRYGLESLLAKYFGVTLDKSLRRSDWGKRPLPAAMLRYAIEDVRFLKPLADYLLEQLKRLGRIEWHEEICSALLAANCSAGNEQPERWRIKGSGSLTPKGLVVLRELWKWREAQALKQGKPPGYIMRPATMIRIARAIERGGLTEAANEVPLSWSDSRFAELLRVVQRAIHLPADQWPEPKTNEPRLLTSSQRKRFEHLQERVQKLAKELALEPSFIASRALLIRLAVAKDPETVEMYRWQRRLLFGS